MSVGDRVEITRWQLGPRGLFPSLVWMGTWTGAEPVSPCRSGLLYLGRKLRGAGCSVSLALLPWAGWQHL